jgi:hypothetical protein
LIFHNDLLKVIRKKNWFIKGLGIWFTILYIDCIGNTLTSEDERALGCRLEGDE